VIRQHRDDWSVFAEIDPFGGMSGRGLPGPLPERSVNASHWYDVRTLFLKAFRPGDGDREQALAATKARYVRELAVVKAAADKACDGAPALIGEFGIPYDLDDGRAYRQWREGKRSGVWDHHADALGLMYDALDELGLNATQWNYTASNRNDLRVGDGWNQEDLSIFSRDQQDDPGNPDSGGRAVEGFCRPFAHAVAGRILTMSFDRASRRFDLRFEASGQGETVIYAPRLWYPGDVRVRVTGPAAEWSHDPEAQRLIVRCAGPGETMLTLQP
jgi:hypothetical protein